MKTTKNLYLLRDGTYADPKDCSKGVDGVLRHESGVAVALKADGSPETIVDATATNAQAAGSDAVTEAAQPVKTEEPASK